MIHMEPINAEYKMVDAISKDLVALQKRHSSEYYTNNIHKYPAKMIMKIPSVVIPYLSSEQDLILDPFCGSGTVLLEAKLKNRKAVGLDINPLAALISKVKTKQLDRRALFRLKNKLKASLEKQNTNLNEMNLPNLPNRSYWFSRTAERQLATILFEIKKIKNKDYYDFFMICFSACIRYASRADPEIVPPVVSKKMRKILKIRRSSIRKYFLSIVDKNIKRILTLPNDNFNSVKVSVSDAREMSINDESVDLVLTSPPYISAQKYPRSLKLEMFWTNLIDNNEYQKLDRNTIGTEKVRLSQKINIDDEPKILKKFLGLVVKRDLERYIITRNYFLDMEKVISEIYRVLKPQRYFVLLIGENTVCGMKAPTAKVLSEYARRDGFSFVAVINDKIRNFGFMTKRNKNAGIIQKEKLLIFKKGGE